MDVAGPIIAALMLAAFAFSMISMTVQSDRAWREQAKRNAIRPYFENELPDLREWWDEQFKEQMIREHLIP